MDYELKPSAFNTVFSGKTDAENEAQYTLSDYMPNVSRIVKTEARLVVKDKRVENGKVQLFGDIVYTILYVAENSGLLKCVVFKEDFEESFDMRVDTEAENLFVSVKSAPLHATSKLEGQRTIAARSKFSLCVDVIDVSTEDFYIDERQAPECNVEYLRKDIRAAAVKIAENSLGNIDESFEIDAGMPEIADIVDARGSVCVKHISISDDMAEVTAEMTLNCLYEAKNQQGGEYVSLEKAFPFKTEVELPGVDGTWEAVAGIKLVSLSCDFSADNFGEQRVIEVNAAADITAAAIKNTQSTVFEDMYSTECCIVPQKENVHTYTLADTYTDTVEYSDRVRFELRGITDIISSSLSLSFSNPELSEGAVYIPARGMLSVLGIKENGETDARSSQISVKIRQENIPQELFENKLRWINFCNICRHECNISNGELVLSMWLSESLAAIIEENVQVITGYEKSPESSKNEKKCSFTLYYPEKGESVWKVAKEHGVSCERVCAENGIDGKSFDGKKTVILR